ncbi:retron St85 family effector protein [Rodentibacter pneumotropicus]|uniref:Retron St85 family effector protein n=1 Tax=Rodentibacter pneumotropicus TaxID=758 RepID=A0AAW5LEA5_9PAST|nr:retron St85 family effector protein [Rodentibacter pneumotropicus]MCQ9122065.1 retron St85 family effector protein [Rodentibacter pneumotropicus]
MKIVLLAAMRIMIILSLEYSFLIKKSLFVGGAVPDNSVAASFRQRVVISMPDDIPFVLAETFKDYFKDNRYPDLLVFEDDIAQISSVILIFLESPGSLVELGMFISKPEFYKKLLIIAPQEEVHGHESFIYLGPLKHIKRKYSDSILIYPWPKKEQPYDKEHVNDVISSLKNKLSRQHKSQKFTMGNSAHISFFIAEIIRLSYPIILEEIQYALMAFNVDIKDSFVSRYLYLLKILEYIDVYEYSGYKYYYPRKEFKDIQFLYFGIGASKRGFDESGFKMKLKQSYLSETDESSKKRQSAMKQISTILG